MDNNTASEEFKKMKKAEAQKKWSDRNPEKLRANSYRHYHTKIKIDNARKHILKYQKILDSVQNIDLNK